MGTVGQLAAMWPSKWIEDDEAVRLLVKKWRGTRAQAWEYSCSHSRFLLRLTQEDEHMNPLSLSSAYLLFYDCFELRFDDGWLGVDLVIENTGRNSGARCLITDKERLRIMCGGVSAVETEVMPFIHLADQLKDP